VHLTNYAINKNNDNFVYNEDESDDDIGHKRSLTSVLKYLKEQGKDVDKLLTEIKDMAIKTIVTVQPSLSHLYRSCQADDVENSMCFEILG
jgi:tubulin polyglutamylase TTLL6/13